MSRSRAPNGASSIYKGSDGNWHGRVTVGIKDDGRSDRRHVKSRSRSIVVQKVRELERLRDAGRVPRAGSAWTVETWMTHWLHNIAKPTLRGSSFAAYRIAVEKHIVPSIGRHRLDRLQPEHLERLYQRMISGGAKPATAHQVHRTLRTAFGEAERRGHVTRNPAAIAKAPRIQPEPIEPWNVDDVRRILDASSRQRNGARWAVALALGLRQGEALALRWSDVDLEAGTLRVRATRVRPAYEHGCKPSCGRSPGFCPHRRLTTPITGETKSGAGKRIIGLPDELIEVLRNHRTQQQAERVQAAQLWQEGDWVFATQTGEALNPNTDYHAWKALLRRAGVRDGRLHDARHTAATVLLVLGVPERTVMGIMGWSSTSMAARYQHVTDPIRRDVARRVGGLLFGPADGEREGHRDGE